MHYLYILYFVIKYKVTMKRTNKQLTYMIYNYERKSKINGKKEQGEC